MPTTAQYAAANRAAGAHTAAQALFDRLVEAEATPDVLTVVEAFCQEMAVNYAKAYEPIYCHLEQMLPTLTDEETPRYQVVAEVFTVTPPAAHAPAA